MTVKGARGAGEGTRTLDIQLGRIPLSRMRHTVHRLNSGGAQACDLALLSSDSLTQASAPQMARLAPP
jgi:hypothetical protein